MAGATFNADLVYGTIVKTVHGVVKKAGRIAVGSARERAPVRKIFSGGRRTAPRFYSLTEAKAELPAFLRSMGRSSDLSVQDLASTGPRQRIRTGQMTRQEALTQLQQTPIATNRNRANSWQRTGTVPSQAARYRRRALDERGNPRKDEHGNSIFVTMRSIEFVKGHHRLFDRSAERELTSRGKYELENATTRGKRRNISFGQSVKAEGSLFDHNPTAPTPGEEGQVGGNLRRSIELHDVGTGDRPKVSIVAGGTDAPYARFVEFGTRHAAAQPFLRPALKHVEGPYKALMREAFPGSK